MSMQSYKDLDPTETLHPKQVRAIELLAQGLKIVEAASELGISERTIQNWKHDKAFAHRLHERFNHLRDEMEAKFNPILERILAGADQFLDRTFKMMDSDDYRVAKIGMQFYLQSLKWAGIRENRGRGNDIGVTGMAGRFPGRGSPENPGKMSRVYKMLNGFSGDTPDVEVAEAMEAAATEAARGEGSAVRENQPVQETGNNRKEETAVVSDRLPVASTEQPAPQTGKNRKADEGVPRAAATCCPCDSEEDPGKSVANESELSHAKITKPEAVPPIPLNLSASSHGHANSKQLDFAQETTPARGTQPSGNASTLPKPEKSGKLKPWQKAPNHVPYYRKFQHR